MGFELKYYQCPKCKAEKLAKNLDNGNFVCDNTEGGCTHFISGKEGYEPGAKGYSLEPKRNSWGSYSISVELVDRDLTDILKRLSGCCSNSGSAVRDIQALFASIGIKITL